MKTITTHQELGYEIYNFCKTDSEKLLNALRRKVKRSGLKNINEEEILIAFMWAIFDLLNSNPAYEKTTHFIFGAYIEDKNLNENEAEKEMNKLEQRFDEYKNIFRKEGETNYNYFPVATKMSQHITGKMTNLSFATALSTYLSKTVTMWAKLLKEIKVTD